MQKKRIAVLGATGSIGASTLDVLSRARDYFDVVLLSANTQKEKLQKIHEGWPGAALAFSGKDLLSAIEQADADITVNGISGAAGLEPSIAAIEVAHTAHGAGISLALANKETVVMAGAYVLNRAREKNVSVIPVDSEHSAVFHLLKAHGRDSVEEIILTASGGPFRNLSLNEMENVTVEDALCHPTWNMGRKITVDSASLANKGLELIEAVRLFDMPPEKVKIAIHPQSIVHSLIRMKDGSLYASLSRPDMRLPIQQALYWPDCPPPCISPLDLDALSLDFSAPDTGRFPMLKLAYDSVTRDGLYPCVYNSVNETSVNAFLQGRIGFLDIPRITGYVLNMDWSGSPGDINTVLETHRRAAFAADSYIGKIKV